ncbi:MAG: hypothetical protein OHK0047_11060 [Leptolyngbyaceae cyanobacterium]
MPNNNLGIGIRSDRYVPYLNPDVNGCCDPIRNLQVVRTGVNQAQLENGRFPIRETAVLDLDKVRFTDQVAELYL